MPSTATVEFEALLTPIAGDNPSGEPLLYTPTYDTIREARRAEDPGLGQGDWKRELKVANWREVKTLAMEALATKSKDLQLAAWLTEALVRQEGFAGAAAGFRVLTGLIDRFWETLYPLPEDGDFEFRAQILESLNNGLPAALSELKLTSSDVGQYSLNEWRDSRQVEEKGLKSTEERDALIKEGKITGEQWDKAVTAGGRSFYESLFAGIAETLQQCDQLAAAVDQKFGRDAPSLLAIRQTLEQCHSLTETIVKKKRELEPDPSPAETPSPDALADPSPDSIIVNGLAQDLQGLAAANQTQTGHPACNSNVISLEPQDRADALRRLAAIAEFFHRTEPHSPVAYLVERAARWGQMPLEEWLNDVITDQSVLSHIRETLGIKNSEQNGG